MNLKEMEQERYKKHMIFEQEHHKEHMILKNEEFKTFATLAKEQAKKIVIEQWKLEYESEIARIEASTMLLKRCKEQADYGVTIKQIDLLLPL